jgi:hypothetical protein
MVGNLFEWVDNWVPQSTASIAWAGGFSDDSMALAGASTTDGPGVLIRGGSFFNNTSAGPLAVSGNIQPSTSDMLVGFRGVR